MEELNIKYTISQKVKLISLLAGIYLAATTLTLGIMQALEKNFAFVFYASLVGLLLAVLLILTVTVWQKSIVITINNQEIDISLPNQQIDGSITWDNVTQVGIGLSYITLTSEPTNYKIDLGNLKYNDLKRVKTKIIEVCESKEIPFSNI